MNDYEQRIAQKKKQKQRQKQQIAVCMEYDEV